MPPTSSVSNDANTFMPLLFAAHADIVPNYKRMAAMDDQGRTASALEHKFRTWRQEGRKILAQKGSAVESAKAIPKKVAGPSRKTNSLKGGVDPGKQFRGKGQNGDDDDEDGEGDEDDTSAGNGAAKASEKGEVWSCLIFRTISVRDELAKMI